VETIRERITSLKLDGKDELYIIHHPALGDILVKPLSFKIFSEIRDLIVRKIVTLVEAEDIIFRACVLEDRIKDLYPNQLLAGDISTIAQQIMEVSAPRSPDELQERINYYTNIASNDIFDRMLMLICTAFPGYTPTDLESMTWKQIARLVGMAQVILMERGLMKQPLEVTQKKKKKRKPRHRVNDPFAGLDKREQQRENIRRAVEARRKANVK